MKPNAPSFLLNRNGIYYFHFRIPKHMKHLHDEKAFIRKSLRTSNRSKALERARLEWYELMKKEQEYFDEALYEKGKEIQSVIDRNPLAMAGTTTVNLTTGKIDSKDDNQIALKYYKKIEQEKLKAQLAYQTNTSNIHTDHTANRLNTSQPNLKLSELVDMFINTKRRGLSKNTLKDYIPIYNNICELLGDPTLGQLSYQLIEKNFSEVIEFMPTHASKKKAYKNKNGERHDLITCIKIAKDKNLDTISYRTLEKYVTQLRSLLNFGIIRKLVDPITLVSLEFFAYITHDPQETDGSYTDEELKTILYDDAFNSERHMCEYPERYWVTLLALYTGARVNEIAQIKVSEVTQDAGFTHIDMLDEERTKRIKNKQSRRLIPLHPDLIELGFHDYYAYQKSIKSGFLFSRLSEPDSLDRYYRRFTNWWYSYSKKLKENGLIAIERTFHDFRNTAIDKEKQDFLNEAVLREVFGHKLKKDAHKRYQNTFKLETKYEEICKLDFNLDLSKIKKWQR